jgi:hypothetical protein
LDPVADIVSPVGIQKESSAPMSIVFPEKL